MEAATQPTEDAIFDASSYDLPIPKDRHGRKADKLQVVLGAIEIDRTDEAALDAFNAIELGTYINLRVSGFVIDAGESSRENEDGEHITTIRRVLKVRAIEKA